MNIFFIVIAIILFIFGSTLQIKIDNNKEKTNCYQQFLLYKEKKYINKNDEIEKMADFYEIYNLGFKDGYKMGSKIELLKIISIFCLLVAIIILLCNTQGVNI